MEVQSIDDAQYKEVGEKKKRQDVSRLRPSQNTLLALAIILLTVFISYLYQYFIQTLK